MSASINSIDVWGIILSVLAIGLACLIWHNQTKQSNEIEKMINRVNEYTNEVKLRSESFRRRSLAITHIRFLSTIEYVNRVVEGVDNITENGAKLAYLERWHAGLKLVLEVVDKHHEEERIFLIPNVSGEQRDKIESALSANSDLINYGKKGKIAVEKWLQIAKNLINKNLQAANSISSDAFLLVDRDMNRIASDLANEA